MGSITPAPAYWQTNIPPTSRTAACPAFLQNLSPKDMRILGTPDAEYHILSWASVRRIIADNRLDLFQRKPSDLRRYLEYCHAIKSEHGSVMRYMLDVRLRWTEADLAAGAKDASFAEEDGVKVLVNDWPYGIDEKIVHLVVWTKFALEDDPDTGDTREDVKREIDGWVDERFGKRCGRENVGAFVLAMSAREVVGITLAYPDLPWLALACIGSGPGHNCVKISRWLMRISL